ncbi:FtsW/RodA/SpoVE family cell cycle protein [Streptomyces sp. 184]|uniref:FtsW/RodA/SpoVE family cell cycle protein n=1 Tax=Streptomyces sp. 184 TaxID=1827526 RepID=UPI0038924EEA
MTTATDPAEALRPPGRARRLATPPPPVPRPRRRGAELALLVCAVAVIAYGYAAVGYATSGALPADLATHVGGLAALALVAHVVVRLRAPCADPVLLPVALLLNGLGLVLIHRLDQGTPGDRAAPAQLLWSTVGVALFAGVLVFLRDHRDLRPRAGNYAFTALCLMAAPILFPAVNGARIWIRIGGLSLQPSEFAKVLLAIFFAAYLAANRHALTFTSGPRIRRLLLPPRRVLGPIVAVWGISLVLLILERDIGASLLFFSLFVAMLYVATGRFGWLAVGLLLAAAGAAAVGALEPHVHTRVEDWLSPFRAIEEGHGPGQLAQSLFAFAAGGALGAGLGQGHSLLIGFAGKSDFILATAGEELGIAGLTALFLLYAIFVARGYRTAISIGEPFGALLAAGLAAIITLQVVVIAGGVLGLIPLTGMVTPFLAQGGSSVVTNWVIVALLVRLSDEARTPKEEPRPATATAPAPSEPQPEPGTRPDSAPAPAAAPVANDAARAAAPPPAADGAP